VSLARRSLAQRSNLTSRLRKSRDQSTPRKRSPERRFALQSGANTFWYCALRSRDRGDAHRRVLDRRRTFWREPGRNLLRMQLTCAPASARGAWRLRQCASDNWRLRADAARAHRGWGSVSPILVLEVCGTLERQHWRARFYARLVAARFPVGLDLGRSNPLAPPIWRHCHRGCGFVAAGSIAIAVIVCKVPDWIVVCLTRPPSLVRCTSRVRFVGGKRAMKGKR